MKKVPRIIQTNEVFIHSCSIKELEFIEHKCCAYPSYIIEECVFHELLRRLAFGDMGWDIELEFRVEDGNVCRKNKYGAYKCLSFIARCRFEMAIAIATPFLYT